jgi:hypothetical protein
MRSKIIWLGLLTFCVAILISGCSTKVSYIPSKETPEIAAGSNFFVAEVVDKSGFKFPPDEKDTLDLKESMYNALKDALVAKNIFNEVEKQYNINVDILEYQPGNAFSRWLLPGAGATKLSVMAIVLDQEGLEMAKIPVKRSIGFGGALTVGAWEYVFREVAEEIVKALIEPSKYKK